MGKDLLLEIGTEEMPASAVNLGIEQLRENASKMFEAKRLSFLSLDATGAPRRLVLLVTNLSEVQSEVVHEIRGPARKVAYTDDGEPTAAAIGFASAQKVKVTDLVVRSTPQGDYVFAIKREKGLPTSRLLPELLPKLILSLSFPKSMRWGEGEIRFVRPIRWLLALYGNKVVDFSLDNLRASNLTWGHRFLAKNPLKVKNPRDYFGTLEEKGKVVVDHRKRERIIRDKIEQVAKEIGGRALIDPQTFTEVVNLVEFPHTIFGAFPSEYVSLPHDVLATVMESHQRYFPVEDEEGNLLPYFIVVHNGDPMHDDTIRKGHEMVLTARLADAKFFYEEDQKEPLAARLEKLKGIIFQEKLGTLHDKAKRVQNLVMEIGRALKIDESTLKEAERVAYLSKADLLTEMVGEFSDLQGIMGREYARLSGEPENVAIGIFEHYLPRFASDILPSTPVGKIVSIADKLDTIVGYFSVGLLPTGSEDPYSLRRQGQGIISIILENRFPLSLSEMIHLSLDLYHKAGFKYRPFEEVEIELQDFFMGRFKGELLTEGFNYDIINAVLGEKPDNLTDLRDRVVSIAKYKESPILDDLIVAFTRCKNLSNPSLGSGVKEQLFSEEEERGLYQKLIEVEKIIDEYLERTDYDRAIENLAGLRPYVDRFFDKVLVMTEDKRIRHNRVSLLNRCVELFLKIADFSQLVIPGN